MHLIWNLKKLGRRVEHFRKKKLSKFDIVVEQTILEFKIIF